MLSIDHLVVRFGAATVLDGVSLRLGAGEVHGLVGRNGEGKTTLLDAVFGIVRRASGQVSLNGRSACSTDLGYLQAHNHFYPKLTGREYLRIFQTTNSSFDVEAWGRIFGLPLERLVERYSAGMQKKLAFLGVLSLERPVLMLDEPFNGLDLETNQLLGRLIRMLADGGKTILLTSHVLETLTSTCDRIHVLAGGRVVGSFLPAEYGRLEGFLLTGWAGERLELAHRLLAGERRDNATRR